MEKVDWEAPLNDLSASENESLNLDDISSEVIPKTSISTLTPDNHQETSEILDDTILMTEVFHTYFVTDIQFSKIQ